MEFESIAAAARAGMNHERGSLESAALRLAHIGVTYSSRADALTASQKLLAFSEQVFGSDSRVSEEDLVRQIGVTHDPTHPLANADGNVYSIKIDHVSEMVRMSTAIRAYEANVRAFNTGAEMNAAALRIGER